jgi:serine/threonine-protein phosphatase 5
VDRGSQQCEVLLTLLFAFLLFPNRVFLNRGNHEDLSLNLSNHFAPNFNSDCSKKFGQYGNEFFKQSQELFRYLPIATFVTNKGIFSLSNYEKLVRIKVFVYDQK